MSLRRQPGKVERATPLLNKLEQREVILPLANVTWLVELEQELLSWIGLNDEPSDPIDAAAYATEQTVLSKSPIGLKTFVKEGDPDSARVHKLLQEIALNVVMKEPMSGFLKEIVKTAGSGIPTPTAN